MFSLVLFIVPHFIRATFFQGESYEKQPRQLPRLLQWTLWYWEHASIQTNFKDLSMLQLLLSSACELFSFMTFLKGKR